MTHPHQQSHAVLAPRLKQTAVTVVVHPLGQFRKIPRGTLRLAITFGYDFMNEAAPCAP